MTFPGIIFWMLLLFVCFSRGAWIYYLIFASWSFGTLAVLPPSLTASSITPAWVCAIALALREGARVGFGKFLNYFFDAKTFLPLTLVTIYGVFSSVIMPNLFAGKFEVVVMRLSEATPGAAPLAYSAANVTQSLYFIICSVFTVAVYSAAKSASEMGSLLKGFQFGAVVAVVTGLADIGLSQVGATSLLLPFRNAAYSLMVDDDVMGIKRTVGLMSEASSYGGLTFGFLSVYVFAPNNWTPLTGRPIVQILIISALVAMVYLSTSSGALAMLGLLLFLMFLNFVRGLFVGRPFAAAGIFSALIALTCAVGAVLFLAPIAEFVQRFLDTVIFTKSQSQSYIERSSWNRIAMEAFYKTYGLGAGLGSVRASSWAVSVLGNIGFPGAALILLLIGRALVGSPVAVQDREKLWSIKLPIVLTCVGASLSSTSPNYGLPMAFLLGIALSFIS